jgi:transposase
MHMKQGIGQQKLAALACEEQENSYQQRLQELAAKYEQELQEQESNYQQRLQELAAKYEQKLQEQESNYQQHLQELAAKYEQKLQEQESNYQQHLQTVEEHLRQAHARIAELERRLSKDSHNSSKPPSSDGLRRKTRSQRKPSGKKSGGQVGHPGVTLSMVASPDAVVLHRAACCQQCGTDLQEMGGRVVERRQVHDLPEIRLQVTEHQVEEIRCPQCSALSRGSFPPEVSAPVQYGPQIRAWGVYLNQYQIVSVERTCQTLCEAFGCSISQGTLLGWVQEASKRLRVTMEQIKQALLKCKLVHPDETGIHLGKKLHWLHNVSTCFLTYLAWHPKRGRLAMDAIGILPQYQGRIMRDRLSSYDHYNCDQSICGAHLLRDLMAVWEQFKQKWARAMHRLLVAINKVAYSWRSRGASCVPKEIRDRWVARYFRILALGYAAQPPPVPRPPGKRGRMGQSEPKNLLDALLHRAHQVLAFLDNLTIPFTNNQAERDLRMVKVQQKVAGTFRSEDGVTAYCSIRSYLSTMHKQARPLLEALAAVFLGHPFPIALSLG